MNKNLSNETKKCKYCQTEIDKKAKICPNCKKKQSNNVIAIVIGVILIGSVILSLSEDTSDNSINYGDNQEKDISVISNVNNELEEIKLENDNQIGSRKNPVPLMTEIEFEHKQYEFLDEILGAKMKVSKFYRGQDAIDYAISLDNYNKESIAEDLSKEEELIIFEIEFDLIKYQNKEDEPFLVSDIWIDFYDTNYGEIVDSYIYVAGIKDLHSLLYEGASTSGMIAIKINKNVSNPKFVFDKKIWFELYEE